MTGKLGQTTTTTGGKLPDVSTGTGSKPTGSIAHLDKPTQQFIQNANKVSTAKPNQATAPRDLKEQVLWNQVKQDPAAGQKLNLGNDPRFPASAGFQKMQATHRLPDGSSITIHYQYNSNTGKAYDMKITTPKPAVLQPSVSIKG